VHSIAIVLKQPPVICPRQPTRQPCKSVRQVARMPPIVAAHWSRQLSSAAPLAALHPPTHRAPAASASAKHARAGLLQWASHDAQLAAEPVQVVRQSAAEAAQATRAAREAVMHDAWHRVLRTAHPRKQAAYAVRACSMQAARPCAHPLACC
jgi:hypothetical protein